MRFTIQLLNMIIYRVKNRVNYFIYTRCRPYSLFALKAPRSVDCLAP